MALLEDFVTWCDKQRGSLRQQLTLYESGKAHTGRLEDGRVGADTTAETIARIKQDLAELDTLLAQHGR